MASVTLWLNVKAGGTVRSLPCLFQNGKMSRIVLMYFTAEDMLKQSTSQRRAAAIAITQLSDMCLTRIVHRPAGRRSALVQGDRGFASCGAQRTSRR